MQADEIIQTVYDAGGQLWLEGDKVRARLPESLRPLVSAIREPKPELIELLLAQQLAVPAGVRLVLWSPKDAPIQLSQCETVVDVDIFIRSTLRQMDARLHGKDWLAGWTLSTLLDRLAAVGCHVARSTMERPPYTEHVHVSNRQPRELAYCVQPVIARTGPPEPRQRGCKCDLRGV